MNCQGCGATMRYMDGRNYFVCDYCTSFHFSDESTASPDGVKDFGDQSDKECPVCHVALVSGAIEGHSLLHCAKCRGVLATNDAFGVIVPILRARGTDDPGPRKPINPEDLQRQVQCPQCRRVMDVHPYYGPGAVVVDTCFQCRLIWLDHGEIAAIERAPGRRPGRPEQTLANDE